jgi:mRNA guanylyltransferase
MGGWWKPIKVRTDKTHPNNRRTFYRTLVNIKEDIKMSEFNNICT